MVALSMNHYRDGLQQAAAGNYVAAIGFYEKALLDDPNDARTLYALAVAARAIGADGVAEKFLVRVLAISPGQIEAIVSLANLLRMQGRFAETQTLLTHALQANPASPELLMTLGSVVRETAQSAADESRAETYYRAALKQRRDYLPALGNLADMLAEQGRIDEFRALYRQLRPVADNNPQIRLNYAIQMLSCGQLPEGWKDYAGRLEMPTKVPAADHNLPRWDGTFQPGTRVLISAEQGIGDQVMFASILPDLLTRATGMHVILECEPRLQSLFARSFPTACVHSWDVRTQNGKTTSHYGWLGQAGGADSFCELGTLPEFFRQVLTDFPDRRRFLTPDAHEAEYWRGGMAALPRPLIGLCWRSGKSGGHRSREYAPLQAWAALIQTLPGTPVVTQYDAQDEEIATLERLSGRSLYVPPGLDQKLELDRTVAFLSVLDAVVSAPTAVSWLAGGAGVPTYKILRRPSWTSFGTDNEPFGSAIRCLTQAAPGDWSGVFATATHHLRKFFEMQG